MFDGQDRQLSLPWTSSAAASPARTSAALALAQGLTASAPASGTNTAASSKRCAPRGSSSKTSHLEGAASCVRCRGACKLLVTIPLPSRFLRPTLELPTDERGSLSSPGSALEQGGSAGLWPTPTAQYRGTYGQRHGKKSLQLAGAVRLWPTPTATSYGTSTNSRPLNEVVRLWPTVTAKDGTSGAVLSCATQEGGPSLRTAAHGPLNPAWVEQLLGCPEGWTDSPPDKAPSNTTGKRRARPRKSRSDPRG